MELRVFELPPIATNAYLLIDRERGDAVLFDAPYNAWESAQPVLEESGCELSALILTHGHWDHMLGAASIAARGIRTYAHPEDLNLIESPSEMAALMLPGVIIPPGKVDEHVADGQNMSFLNEPVEVRHVPGHSPGSVLFYFRNHGLAVSGDAIFAGGIGRTDFPGCSRELLETSILEQIYTLPDDTILLPGHGPRTTVGHEKATNPFVRA
jgi:glyoxylase-like metal-dependent hydrolase (beta-lactamase superfamily II)